MPTGARSAVRRHARRALRAGGFDVNFGENFGVEPLSGRNRRGASCGLAAAGEYESK
jgi:hypothetical protein